MKPKIFFDFDDTLFVTKHLITRYIHEQYDVVLPPDEYHCGNSLYEIVVSLRTDIKIDRETFWRSYAHDFLASTEWHKNIEPYPDMIETMQQLAKKYEIIIVTARQEISRPVVKQILDIYLPNTISHVHYVWKIINGIYVPYLKADFISDLSGEKVAFFDDNPGEIDACSSVIKTILFDPYYLHKGAITYTNVHSWKEIGEFLA